MLSFLPHFLAGTDFARHYTVSYLYGLVTSYVERYIKESINFIFQQFHPIMVVSLRDRLNELKPVDLGDARLLRGIGKQ